MLKEMEKKTILFWNASNLICWVNQKKSQELRNGKCMYSLNVFSDSGSHGRLVMDRGASQREEGMLHPGSPSKWFIFHYVSCFALFNINISFSSSSFFFLVIKWPSNTSLDCKDIKSVNLKGNQPWIFNGRTDAEALILWPPDGKNWLIGKDPDARKD